MKNIRSSQATIPCTELSKTQLFPVSIVMVLTINHDSQKCQPLKYLFSKRHFLLFVKIESIQFGKVD